MSAEKRSPRGTYRYVPLADNDAWSDETWLKVMAGEVVQPGDFRPEELVLSRRRALETFHDGKDTWTVGVLVDAK